MKLVCSGCGEAGTLEEEVRVECSARRSVSARWEGGEVKAEFGVLEDLNDDFGADVLHTVQFVCTSCGGAFPTLKEATSTGLWEHRCSQCGWWGTNDWQHALQSPGCAGELNRLPLPVVAA